MRKAILKARQLGMKCWVHVTPFGFQHTHFVKAHLWACSKSLQIQLSHLLRNDQDLWEVWLLLMRSDPKRVVHAEEKEKKEKKKRPFG